MEQASPRREDIDKAWEYYYYNDVSYYYDVLRFRELESRRCRFKVRLR